MPLTLEIVTPDARVYAETIDSVVIPTAEGEVGILPGHIPLLAQLAEGELRVTKGAQTQLLAVCGGFAQVDGEKISVLKQCAGVVCIDGGMMSLAWMHKRPTVSVVTASRAKSGGSSSPPAKSWRSSRWPPASAI